MRLVVQRATDAAVTVEERKTAEITNGMVVLAGISEDDDENTVNEAAAKVAKLRIFPDPADAENGQKDINRSILDTGGEVLAVSQFTLLADTSAGNRPSFRQAARPERASHLFDTFVAELERLGIPVQTGEFGTFMEVSLTNTGPVTIVLDI